jgi:branched-chain amino acid transport system permease protein
MYIAFYAFTLLGVQSAFGGIVGPYVAILLAAPALFAFGFLIHKTLISRVTGARTAALEGEGHYAQLILTLGIALIMQNGAMILFGSELLSIRTPLSSAAWEIGPFWGDFVSVFVNKSRAVSALISVLVIVLLWALITRSRLGKALRASADNPDASTYMGIDVDHAHRIAFALGTCTTGIAGGLLATNYPFHPFVVCRRRARRHRQHHRPVLGRHDDRAGAAALDPGPADPAAERHHLRHLPADHRVPPAGLLRPRRRENLRCHCSGR